MSLHGHNMQYTRKYKQYTSKYKQYTSKVHAVYKEIYKQYTSIVQAMYKEVTLQSHKYFSQGKGIKIPSFSNLVIGVCGHLH